MTPTDATLPIDPLKWREWDDGNTDFRKASAWGYRLTVLDHDGDYVGWFVAHTKTGHIVADGSYPGDYADDWDEQFEACMRLATLAAWECAKQSRTHEITPDEWKTKIKEIA